MSTLQLVDKIFIEGAMPKKALKYALFQKKLRPKSSFLNIFHRCLQKPHTPFLPYFDTKHLIRKILYFVRRGFPELKKKI